MIFESKYGKVNMEHVQRNSDGYFYYLSVIDAIRTQSFELYKVIDIENMVWIAHAQIQTLMTTPERLAEKKAKDKQVKEDQFLEEESKKLRVCFSPTWLGAIYETGLSSEDAVHEEISFGTLLNLLEHRIKDNKLSVKERDWVSVCRYRLLVAKKDKNDLIQLANSKGLKDAEQ